MSELAFAIVLLPGAGGGSPDPAMFGADICRIGRVVTINYPGWRRYLTNTFSANELIEDLVSQITTRVPEAPIYIIGISLGGHLGYATALHLQAMGHQIRGFCAIDTFMVKSVAPRPGWKGRALADGLEALRKGRLIAFMRSRFWRGMLRLVDTRLSELVRKAAYSKKSPFIFSIDPTLEQELNMRLLLKNVTPWLGSLDLKPATLNGPSILIRTAANASDDAAWRRRCPSIEIFEIPGTHHSIFESENVADFREFFRRATRRWFT